MLCMSGYDLWVILIILDLYKEGKNTSISGIKRKIPQKEINKHGL